MSQATLAPVKGLTYLDTYITPAEAAELLNHIDQQPWLADLKRRVQHYGYKYDYRARKIDQSMRLGPLPVWLQPLAQRLHAEQHILAVPEQIIINEYLPGQGIADHIDCEPCFGGTILSLTLGSGCMMNFTHASSRARESVWLAPQSLIIMQNEARYEWLHGIPARRSDRVAGEKRLRTRRVSLTFRTVIG